METFDSTKRSLFEILRDVHRGKIQLPDFQRGWIWDDNRIKGILASVAKSFPIGAIMLLETGNENVRFKTKPVEGVKLDNDVKPDLLILDGQQRITSLYQTIVTNEIVTTRNEKNYEIKRWYYIDMVKAMDDNYDLEEAIISLNEKKQITEDFGRRIVLDLSKKEFEYKNLMYPVCMIDDYSTWRRGFNEYWQHNSEKSMFWDKFEDRIINSFNKYMLPVIIMKKENSKEAVCQVFEKVNTGGVPLNVFELLTATFAADEFDLKKDWQKIKEEFNNYKLLSGVSSTDVIQAITLIVTYNKKVNRVKQNIPDEESPTVSCKRKDMLELSLQDYQISSRTNRIISGEAPSKYLVRIKKHAEVSDDEFRNVLKSHALSPELLYADDFENFFIDRKEKILQKIEKAMNKSIPREAIQTEEGVYMDEGSEEE
ncbi:MAG: GmrSD restriction endonuclease domain-containing protein [Bacillota bacterium]|jgi:hypothetical protein